MNNSAENGLVTDERNESLEDENQAVREFLAEPSHLNFGTWYSPQICQYLLFLTENKAKCIVVMMQDRVAFELQLGALLMICRAMNKKAFFICKEPGMDSHYICALYANNQLLLINPMGITEHKNFYAILAEAKQKNNLDKIYLSTLKIQHDKYEKPGIVSCGPIVTELGMHILSKDSNDLQRFFKNIVEHANKYEHREGLDYYLLEDLKQLLSETLFPLLECNNEQDYQDKIVSVRQGHLNKLKELPQQLASSKDLSVVNQYLDGLKEGTNAQKFFNKILLNQKYTMNNIIEEDEYKVLELELSESSTNQHAALLLHSVDSARPKISAVYQSRQERGVDLIQPGIETQEQLMREILIPANGNCLYTAIFLGYILPVINNLDEFKCRVTNLINADCCEELLNGLFEQKVDIEFLKRQVFSRWINKFKKNMGLGDCEWGGLAEIKVLVAKLNIGIQEYYPNPAGSTDEPFVKSDLTCPTTNENQEIINILRANPDGRETGNSFDDSEMLAAKRESALNADNFQHYRLIIKKSDYDNLLVFARRDAFSVEVKEGEHLAHTNKLQEYEDELDFSGSDMKGPEIKTSANSEQDKYEEVFNDFPFLISKKRGLIHKDKNGKFYYTDLSKFKSKFDKKNSVSASIPFKVIINMPFYAKSEQTISKAIQIFENTGFGPDREASKLKAAESLVFIIGINMMESLDPDLNVYVEKKLNEEINTACEVHRFAFYWRPRWMNSKNQEIPFDDMRKHYLELKKKNHTLAKTLLVKIEKSCNQIVPYREIREVLKQHVFTSKIAQIFRRDNSLIPVYLGLFDPDIISASQVFETYSNLINNYQDKHPGSFPTVLSTGYKVPALDVKLSHSPLYAFAVDLDMAVRQATAEHVKNGIYYPEPNILISFNSDSMAESFMEGASLGQPKEYSDSYEWPIFMQDILTKRKLDPNEHFIFDASNNYPIITSMPDRMRYELESKASKLKVFHGKFNSDQRIIRWRISDLKYLIDNAQSHASPRAWASRLLRSLSADELNKKCVEANNKIKKNNFCDKKFQISATIVENILKVFFEKLDPFSILINEADVTNNKPIIKDFYRILGSYFANLPLVIDTISEDIIKTEIKLLISRLAEAKGKDKQSIEREIKAWKNEELQYIILFVLGDKQGLRFINAGFAAAQSLTKMYHERLNTNFSTLSKDIIDDFYHEASTKTGLKYAVELPFTKIQEIIFEGEYDPDNLNFTVSELLETGKYNLNGLHIAALVGDSKLVDYAMKKIPDDSKADGEFLPLHCAILYLINNGVSETNGNDLPLITSLAIKSSRLVKMDIGLTALGLAITRLEHAETVIKQCMINWDISGDVKNDIITTARLASLKERCTPILAMMHKLGKKNTSVDKYNMDSLLELEKHGFSFLDSGVIENRILIGWEPPGKKEMRLEEELPMTTIAEAVYQNDWLAFQEICKRYKTTGLLAESNIVDIDNRPLAISAIINTDCKDIWLHHLQKLGIQLAVVDPYDGSPILHEAISPAASRRMGGTAHDKSRYYYGQKDYCTKAFFKDNIVEHPSLEKILTIDFLLQQPGIDPNKRDDAGELPLEIALEDECPYTIWLLVKYGAKLDSLNDAQLNKLIQYFGLLYFIKEIDRTSVTKVMKRRLDVSNIFWKKWATVTKIIDEDNNLRDELCAYQFFSGIQSNYEGLFETFDERKQFSSIYGILAYVQSSFEYYLLNLENTLRLFSLQNNPEILRLEIHNLYSQQQSIYGQIKKFTRNYFEKVFKTIERAYDSKLIEKMSNNEVDEQARQDKKSKKKELEKQGFSARQIKNMLHASAISKPSVTTLESKNEQLIQKVQRVKTLDSRRDMLKAPMRPEQLVTYKGYLSNGYGYSLKATPEGCNAKTLNHLGDVYKKQGNLAVAKNYYERAMKNNGECSVMTVDTEMPPMPRLNLLGITDVGSRQQGIDDFKSAATLSNLGTYYLHLGKLVEAKGHYESALKIFNAHYGVGHIESAKAIMNLGNVFLYLGKLAEAKEHFERALTIKETHYGLGHVETAAALLNLGSVYLQLGKLVEAKEYFERALKIQKTHYELGHIEMAVTLLNLGSVYLQLGKLVEAKGHYESALTIKETHYGLGHFETGNALLNLGSVYLQLGKLDEAKECSERALNIQEAHFESNHVAVAKTLCNLGGLYLQLKQYVQAKQYLLRAKEICNLNHAGQQYLPQIVSLLQRANPESVDMIQLSPSQYSKDKVTEDNPSLNLLSLTGVGSKQQEANVTFTPVYNSIKEEISLTTHTHVVAQTISAIGFPRFKQPL